MFSLRDLRSVTGSSCRNTKLNRNFSSEKQSKMRFFVLTLFCVWCGVAVGEQNKMAERLELIWEKYDELKRNCSVEVSTEDNDSAEAEVSKCLLACILRRASILNGEGYSRQHMDGIASFVFQDEPELKSLAHQVHLNCEKKLAGMKLTDECELGRSIHTCLQKGWKQAGFKHWTPKRRESSGN